MKKILPVVVFLLGILLVVGVYFFVIKGKNKEVPVDEEEAVVEIPLEKRPLVSLTPTADGHYLNLLLKDIKIEADSLDYELLYQTGNGITQGVPGTVKLQGKSEFDASLLLGSESSGKFRYDEGVSEGTITLRFRDAKGKLVGKLSTQFHLQGSSTELTSLDGKFKFTLDKATKDYFVVMETFGLPKNFDGNIVAGPYGVFSSDSGFAGKIEMEGSPYIWSGQSWEKLDQGKATDIGIFVSASS